MASLATRVCPSCQAVYQEETTLFCGRCGSDMRGMPGESAAPDAMLGRVIDGRYRVLSKLGQGGMGAVYQVEHLAMGKRAAMKILHPQLSQDAELGARFRREAEAVSRLSHPNTVQVFDFAQSHGLMYLVMELVRGEDLGTVLRRDGPLKLARARAILMQVCEALAEAHEAGIVHRDLKPENIIVSRTRDGRELVKVLDFGLAKLRDTEELSSVTARGSLVGTPFYMSPEQIRAEDLDARSDIYSLGALLYRMVTGEHPHTGPTPVAVLTQHLTEAVVPPTKRRPDLGLHTTVDKIVARAMAKRREDRIASADELRHALEQAGGAVPDRALEGRVSERRRAADRPRSGDSSGVRANLRREDLDGYERALKRRRFIGLLVLPVLAFLGVGGFAIMHHRNTPRPVEEEREPNNSAKQSNPIASSQTVRGHVGKCLSPEESDRDYYHFRIAAAPQVLKLNLTGLLSMDVKLQVFDGNGQRIAEADDLGPTGGEDLPNVRLEEPGEYYLAVREVWVKGKPASEDESHWYTLTAEWHPLLANQESEPNDLVAQALPLSIDQPMRGYAGRAGDVDYYYPRGEGGGTLQGRLSEIDGVDLRLVVLPAGATYGPPGPLPSGAKVFDAGGAGEPEKIDGVPWRAGSAGPILVVERRDPVPTGDARHHTLVGLHNPYSLTVRLTR